MAGIEFTHGAFRIEADIPDDCQEPGEYPATITRVSWDWDEDPEPDYECEYQERKKQAIAEFTDFGL